MVGNPDLSLVGRLALLSLPLPSRAFTDFRANAGTGTALIPEDHVPADAAKLGGFC